MTITPSLRQIMADRESLRRYASGQLSTFDDVKRRLFLLERGQDQRLPDHFYKRGREISLAGIKSLPGLLTIGLHRLGSEHLELNEKKVWVKTESWPDWQELVTFCSPLVCICALLWKEAFRPGTWDIVQLADFMLEWIEPNTRHTCLPSPRFPYMEKFRQESGLPDLHIHLNGSTETDVAWQGFLKYPVAVYTDIATASRNDKVQDQLEQEFPSSKGSLEFYRLLCTAIRLRYGFVHRLFNGRYTPELAEPFAQLNTEHLLMSSGIAERSIHPRLEHPLLRVFKTSPASTPEWTDISLEALLYIMVMDSIEATGDKKLAACFHHYLLILGLFNRFLVQQTHQCGFDQFQKITLNNFRDVPEKQYSQRFFQLHGNDSANLACVEGRFAPKSCVADNIRLIRQIAGGWEKFVNKCPLASPRRQPRLRLVCHFIKEADTNNLDQDLDTRHILPPMLLIRHRTQRISYCRKAQALMHAYEADKQARLYLCGIDAAANELESPPEVFAPVYRYLRRKGIRHFTYHVGEDFHHLIGGLRAIYEAVEFLGFRRGDRVGHGTAAGIDPQLWLDHAGDELAMSQGEWLDDLIFAIHLIKRNPSPGLSVKLALLRFEAEQLAHEIYCQHFSIRSHTQAWLARSYCPFHLLYDLDEAMGAPTWSLDEWRAAETIRQDREALELLRLYHRADCRKRYHKKITISVPQLFSATEIKLIQDTLLSMLHQREIVLEVLPTSNVRISFYKNHKEHHVWRWLGIGEGQVSDATAPPVVLGTDDPGIFSTNIYNEYCHIYHHLVQTHKLTYDKAAEIIRGIAENEKTYGFTIAPVANHLNS